MPKRSDDRSYPSHFTPLIAHLATQEADSVTLTFAEIEAIIGRPLSVSARVGYAMWSGASRRIPRDLQAIGWRARLNVQAHVVAFRRDDVAMQEG